ncbi:aldo/keto reductase [Acholeplasma hippikon]|uniref:Glyoxal reductase n=1 Tax=Acholeplasma hippikon TaxID=264636 RepID=A0A449BJI2_9MOLU|nr:aldo/keto reductase [Acholeplasma hippikon]VEU82619.1 Glyoxal reductase [Acholeplasma hippikon]
MKYITLHNGVRMPQFGLGTFKVEAGESAYETVKRALKIGYRHIDTAIMYGNEADVAKAIKDSGIKREEIFVTSKFFKLYSGDKEKIRKDIDASLSRLDLGYVDLMLIHWPNMDEKINQAAWSVLEEYYEKGAFRAIGVSNFQIHHLERLLESAKIVPMINQVECHPLLAQFGLQKYLISKGIQMTSYGPFAKGRVFEEPTASEIKSIAEKHQATITQVIIAWGLQRGIVMIPKSVHEDRLIENFNGTELVLSQSEMERMNALNRGARVYTDPDNNAVT